MRRPATKDGSTIRETSLHTELESVVVVVVEV